MAELDEACQALATASAFNGDHEVLDPLRAARTDLMVQAD